MFFFLTIWLRFLLGGGGPLTFFLLKAIDSVRCALVQRTVYSEKMQRKKLEIIFPGHQETSSMEL